MLLPTDTRGREMLQVRALPLRVDYTASPQVAHAEAHGREALRVRPV